MNKILSVAAISLVTLGTLIPLTYAENENRSMRSKSGSTLTETMLTCVRTAVNTREASVKTAYSNLSLAYLSGLDARAKSLDAAWTLTDASARKTARDAAWTTWNTTAKSARETFRSERKAAWETFRTSVKSCKVSPGEVESSTNQNQDVQ